MIDGFGHNGSTVERRFGVVGIAGRLRFLVTASEMLVAIYADPRSGALHESVPLPRRLIAAANDRSFNGR